MAIIEFPVSKFSVEKPLPKIDLTDAERAVVDLVFGVDALKNPVRPSINKALQSIDREIAFLSPLAGGTGNQVIPTKFGIPAPPGPGGISDTEIQTLINSLNSLRTEITQYRTHSDRVSGFTLPTGTNPPSFPGLLGVAVAHNLIKNSLEPEGTPEKDFFSFIFETLLGSAELLMNRSFTATFQIFERLNGGLDGTITLNLSGAGANFLVGEAVEDTTTLNTGIVKKWTPSTNTLIITQADPGDFVAGNTVQGQTTGATRTIASEQLPAYDLRNPSATPKSSYISILAAVNALVGPINSLSNIDDSNYFEALDLITKFGLAQTISSLAKEDLYARFLFNNVNGTVALKKEIEALLEEEEEVSLEASIALIGPEGELIEP